MRRKLVALAFILFQLAAVSAFAQIQVKGKSVFSVESGGELITFPQIAFNTDTGESLVVWSEVYSEKTYGRIVKRNGKSGTAQLNLIEGDATESSVAYNSITKEYLLAYVSKIEGNPEIFVRRLNVKARPVAPAIHIREGTGFVDNNVPGYFSTLRVEATY